MFAQTVPDRLEGRWWGHAGTELDRIEIGFEFKRDSAGRMIAYIYEPVGNFYGLDIGPVQPDSGRLRLPSWNVILQLNGDSLGGTMFFNRAPLSLARASSLPAEVPVPDLPRGPGPAWQLKLGAPVFAAAALRDNIAYVGTAGGMFHAVDAAKGTFLWSFAAGRPIHGEAVLTNDHVFFVCDNGYLFKLKRSDGVEVWRYDLGDARTPRVLMHQVTQNSGEFDWDMAAPKPILDDGVVFVGAGDGSMHAVNAESGQRVWSYEGTGKIRGSAVVRDGRVVFGAFSGFVRALDRATGTLLWERNTSGPVVTAVSQIGDRIIVGNRYGVLASLDAATGNVRWATQLWGSSAESAAEPASGSFFYFGSSDLRRVALMDARDGRVLWRTDVFGWAWARPVLHGNRLFVATVGAEPYQIRHKGALTALDPANGTILWRWPMPELPGVWGYGFFAPPAVDDSFVIIGGLDGTLYGFRSH